MLLELRGLLSPQAASDAVTELSRAPFVDGKSTAFGSARGVKNNLQLDPQHRVSQALGGGLVNALGKNELFKAGVLPHTIYPFMFCRYSDGMAYGEHLDVPILKTNTGPFRSDLAITVWLSPRDTYDGGELVVQSEMGERVFKGDAGDAIIYPSSTLHRVSPVTRGERVVGISWIQSLIRVGSHRAILLSLAEAMGSLADRADADAEVTRLRQIHYRLVRLWAEC